MPIPHRTYHYSSVRESRLVLHLPRTLPDAHSLRREMPFRELTERLKKERIKGKERRAYFFHGGGMGVMNLSLSFRILGDERKDGEGFWGYGKSDDNSSPLRIIAQTMIDIIMVTAWGYEDGHNDERSQLRCL